ncbi:hypothetical protein HY493_04430 [Candidatus Woesearchaeota archaeon]|nr:hypothetical protein [Candidatus Woesearchaeota archaeon]
MFQTPFQPILADMLSEDGFVLGRPVYRAELIREYLKHGRESSTGEIHLDDSADEVFRQAAAVFDVPDVYSRVIPSPGDPVVVRRQSRELGLVLVTYDIVLGGPRQALNNASPADIERILGVSRGAVAEEFGVFTKWGDRWSYVDAITAEPGKMFYSFHEKGAKYDLREMRDMAMYILSEAQDEARKTF